MVTATTIPVLIDKLVTEQVWDVYVNDVKGHKIWVVLNLPRYSKHIAVWGPWQDNSAHTFKRATGSRLIDNSASGKIKEKLRNGYRSLGLKSAKDLGITAIVKDMVTDITSDPGMLVSLASVVSADPPYKSPPITPSKQKPVLASKEVQDWLKGGDAQVWSI